MSAFGYSHRLLNLLTPSEEEVFSIFPGIEKMSKVSARMINNNCSQLRNLQENSSGSSVNA